MNFEAARDPENYFDHRAVVGDLIELFNELADLLSADAARGEFGRFGPWLSQAEALLVKLNRSIDPHVLDLYRAEAETAIARLRAAFQLVDVQGRA